MVGDVHAYGDDGAHERRDEHGADNHRRGVDVEAQRGDEDGHDEDEDVDAAERHTLADGFLGLGLGDEETRQIKESAETLAQPVELVL